MGRIYTPVLVLIHITYYISPFYHFISLLSLYITLNHFISHYITLYHFTIYIALYHFTSLSSSQMVILRGQLLQMIIRSDRPLVNDHPERLASCKLSSGELASCKWWSGGQQQWEEELRIPVATINFFLCKIRFRTHIIIP